MAFEDRVREARKKARLTQEQAAMRIGVAKSTWAGYESGNSQPDINKVVRIMDALGVDANYLWQDYEWGKEKAPEKQELAGNISVEDSTRLLVGLGFIGEGEQLTDADLALLSCVFGILDAWFSRERG